jgi:hypothetical protein
LPQTQPTAGANREFVRNGVCSCFTQSMYALNRTPLLI